MIIISIPDHEPAAVGVGIQLMVHGHNMVVALLYMVVGVSGGNVYVGGAVAVTMVSVRRRSDESQPIVDDHRIPPMYYNER